MNCETSVMRKFLVSVACVASLLGNISRADENRDLTEAERVQLQRDKLIITDRSYRQVFTPYIYSPKPVFITTDSVLNAWHVLLEESIRVMEERFSWELPAGLDKALESLPKEIPDGMPQAQFEAATRRAKLVLGTASKLAGGSWSGGKELDDLIAIDVRRAEEAKEVAMPEWLRAEGCPIQGFDYAVFRPAGIYARKPRMERYFRAVRWLQTVPFDLNCDDQLAAMGLVIAAFDEAKTVPEIVEAFEEIMGQGATLDAFRLRTYQSRSSPFPIQSWMDGVKEKATTDPFFNAEIERPAVILAARRMPDVDLFDATTDEKRPFPNTLEAAALFGSSLAEKLLANEKPKAEQIAKSRTQFKDSRTLYADYAVCLADLFAEPEPGAPDFMKSEPWQRKSLNSGLASWAQFRHAWTLQGRRNGTVFGLADSDPRGFVDPNPEFFRHLCMLVAKSRTSFEKSEEKPLSSLDVSRKAKEMLPLIQATVEPIRKMRDASKAGTKPSKQDEEQYRRTMEMACEPLGFFSSVLGNAGGSMSKSGDSEGTHIGSFSDPESLLTVLQKIADGVGINEVMTKLGPDLERDRAPDRWAQLLDICDQLETLAHKQLRGVEPAADEVEFILSYGQLLGGVMLYESNSWQAPRDDAPRITSVFNRPGEGFLLAGIGRPREIRVLYPWKGKEIECHGAVMPFHEMRSDRHLTDAEWLEKLNGKDAPQSPQWFKPITSQR
jgi:hypothetical protein